MKKKTNETSQRTDKAKSTQQATALRDKITNIILNGKGIRRRVEEAEAMPVKYPRDDGVFYNPEWQDDFIGRSVSKERVAEILLMLKQRRLIPNEQ